VIRKVVYENPVAFFSQSQNFSFRPREDGEHRHLEAPAISASLRRGA
jgi:hypothetical protein